MMQKRSYTLLLLLEILIFVSPFQSCTVLPPRGETPKQSVIVELKSLAESNLEKPSELTLRVLFIFEDGSFVGTDGISSIFVPASELALDQRYVGKVIKLRSCYAALHNGMMKLVVKDKSVTLDLTRTIPSAPEKIGIDLTTVSGVELLKYDGHYAEVSGTIQPIMSDNGQLVGYLLTDKFGNSLFLQRSEYIDYFNTGQPFKVSIDGKIIGYLYLNRLSKRWELIPFGISNVFLNIPKIQIDVQVKLPVLPPVQNLRGSYNSNEQRLTLTWEYHEGNVEFFVYRKFIFNDLEAFELVGRTREKSFSINLTGDHENYTGFGVVVYSEGKESSIALIDRNSIEVR